jgi:hypothetical protein
MKYVLGMYMYVPKHSYEIHIKFPALWIVSRTYYIQPSTCHLSPTVTVTQQEQHPAWLGQRREEQIGRQAYNRLVSSNKVAA